MDTKCDAERAKAIEDGYMAGQLAAARPLPDAVADAVVRLLTPYREVTAQTPESPRP